MNIRKKIIKIYHMKCTYYENIVEKALLKVNGVINVIASFIKQKVTVKYDRQLCEKEQFKEAINKTGYNIKGSNNREYVRLFVIAAAILLVSNFMSDFDMSAILKQSLPGSEANASQANMAKATIEDGIQVIRMTADNKGYTPNVIYVQKNIPVKLIIAGKQLNACNNGIVVPSLNIEKTLKSGENIIGFTPKDEDINFSCWMGMISGVIKVTDNLDSINTYKKY